MTMTRSSGSGMRDLPCASDGNRPRFSRPRFSRPRSSRPGSSRPRSSRPVPGFLVPSRVFSSRVSATTLTRVLATGQEERNKPESSAAKLYCLHLQEQSARSKRARSKRKRKRNPVPIKENSPSPRTCHSLIGCSPSAELTSRGRQSTWSEEPPSAHAQIICLPLRTQLSAPSCNGECGRGSQHLPLSF